MNINKNQYQNNIIKLSKLINHLEYFFENKKYNHKNFINKFSHEINIIK